MCFVDATQDASVLILGNVWPDTIRRSHYLNLLFHLYLKCITRTVERQLKYPFLRLGVDNKPPCNKRLEAIVIVFRALHIALLSKAFGRRDKALKQTK